MIARLAAVTCALFLAPLAATASADGGKVTFMVPTSVTAEAQSAAGAVVTFGAYATYEGRSAKVTCFPRSGSMFPIATTTVDCTARYDDDRHASVSFPVIVRDTTPPAIHTPAPATVHTNSLAGVPSSNRTIAQFLAQATASDTVDGADAVTSNAPAVLGFGDQTITFTAADRAGNTATSSTVVRVVLDSARRLLTPQPGVLVRAPMHLEWAKVARASFYNVQLYRGNRKVLSAWPARTRIRLQDRWKFHGHAQRLTPGVYTWYVWPAFGAKAHAHYGKMVGASTFTVAR